jgi:hypothetical protein
MAAAKSTGKNTKKRGNSKNLAAPWKPGQSGNPKGRPRGLRDRRTVIWAAIERIAQAKKMSPEEVEEALQAAGLEKALKGSFLHYQELSNGLYGKVTDKVDLTSGGKTIADLIALANGGGRAPKPAAEV